LVSDAIPSFLDVETHSNVSDEMDVRIAPDASAFALKFTLGRFTIHFLRPELIIRDEIAT
jgi:hypothetical protein